MRLSHDGHILVAKHANVQGSANDICIFTPTFNRAYCLENLFDSLTAQSSGNFNWLIVDDGSTDDTESLVYRMIENASFPITYLKQENGGKQRAHNLAVMESASELFFCVDSDDALVPDAIESIWNCWMGVKDDPKMAGVIALQGPDADKPHFNWMPDGLSETTMWELYYHYGHKGDTAHIYRTSILKEFPFEVEEGEKFIAETYVYNQIDQHYMIAVLDKVVTIQEYLEDGYTSNVRKITRDNPKSYRKLKRLQIEYSDTVYSRLEATTLYMVGCMLCGETARGIKDAPHPVQAAIAAIPAFVLLKTEFRNRP